MSCFRHIQYDIGLGWANLSEHIGELGEGEIMRLKNCLTYLINVSFFVNKVVVPIISASMAITLAGLFLNRVIIWTYGLQKKFSVV